MSVKGIVIGLVSLVALSGCAGADYTNYAASVDQSNQASKEMVVAYFDKRAQDNQAIMKSLTGGSPENASNNAMSIMLYTILSQQQDERVLQQFVPATAVKPTTNGDIGMAFMNNALPTIVRWGAGAWLGSEIVDGLSQGVALGAGASYVNKSNVGGSVQSPPTYTYAESPQIGGDYSPIIKEAPVSEATDGADVSVGADAPADLEAPL